MLTHGNGPHVGALLLQNTLGEAEAAPLPLDALIAMTQGWIGYLLESSFAELDPSVPIAVLLTRVLVDRDDAAFAAPTKPVGPFYDEAEARAPRAPSSAGTSRRTRAAAGAGSCPARIRSKVLGERARASRCSSSGSVVISCGGGGIPVAAQGSRSSASRA